MLLDTVHVQVTLNTLKTKHHQEQGRSQKFVHWGANSKVEIDDDEYHYCMGSLYF